MFLEARGPDMVEIGAIIIPPADGVMVYFR